MSDTKTSRQIKNTTQKTVKHNNALNQMKRAQDALQIRRIKQTLPTGSTIHKLSNK